MRVSRSLVLIIIIMAALSHRSDGQQARPVAEQLGLAGVMPRGALVYVQARELSALMKTWLASPVRAQFYKSPSFDAFSRSRIYLKLQDRKKDIENAIGFGLDENRLAELAGGLSAVSIYDIGKLELVFVTEIGRERAIATALFKQAPQFQERSSANGTYYVRDVTTDGGRLKQQFCFAHTGGKLIVTTTEGLMIRALGNLKAAGSDALLSDVLATAERAKGFAAHDVTMWLDQSRLNQNRLFNNYWIHKNVSEKSPSSLANIETGLLDLRITADGLNEQRWFKIGNRGQGTGDGVLKGEQASALLRFAPADAQLIEVHAQAGTTDGLTKAVSQALFGKLPGEAVISNTIPDRTRSTSNEDESGLRTERYSRLDTRFDIDVDDEQASRRVPGKSASPSPSPIRPPASSFEKSMASIFTNISPAGYCEMVRSKADRGKPFVRFERAVVVEMKSGASVDRAALERAITDELRARFVVAGIDPRLGWQDEASVRFVAQSLLEQGAAYSVSGKYLVLASSREFARDILQAASAPTPATAAKIDGQVEFFAIVRINDAKPVFDKLMLKLDGRTEQSTAKNPDQEEEQNTDEIKFFSGNLSSLITATSLRELRVRRERDGEVLSERVVYSW